MDPQPISRKPILNIQFLCSTQRRGECHQNWVRQAKWWADIFSDCTWLYRGSKHPKKTFWNTGLVWMPLTVMMRIWWCHSIQSKLAYSLPWGSIKIWDPLSYTVCPAENYTQRSLVKYTEANHYCIIVGVCCLWKGWRVMSMSSFTSLGCKKHFRDCFSLSNYPWQLLKLGTQHLMSTKIKFSTCGTGLCLWKPFPKTLRISSYV